MSLEIKSLRKYELNWPSGKASAISLEKASECTQINIRSYLTQ